MVAETPEAVVSLQAVLALLGLFCTIGGVLVIWLWRHETWFRNHVFPLYQALTGESPRGADVDGSDDGHFQETDDRLTNVEEGVDEVRADVQEVRSEVRELARDQKRHNRETEGWLRRIFSEIEGVDEDEFDDGPLFPDGGPGDPGESPGDD